MVFDVICKCLDCSVDMALVKYDEDKDVYHFQCGTCGDKVNLKGVA